MRSFRSVVAVVLSCIVLGVVVVLGVAVSPGGASTASPACKAAQLSGTFRVIPGSAGAGNIVYSLRLKNQSRATCFVTGIPGLTLLASNGHRLPTHVIPVNRGALTAVLVTLAPGHSAVATARFSPDIPGPGEHVMGACEPTSAKLRVAMPGGGTLIAPISPPTPVCEHGSLQLTALTHA